MQIEMLIWMNRKPMWCIHIQTKMKMQYNVKVTMKWLFFVMFYGNVKNACFFRKIYSEALQKWKYTSAHERAVTLTYSPDRLCSQPAVRRLIMSACIAYCCSTILVSWLFNLLVVCVCVCVYLRTNFGCVISIEKQKKEKEREAENKKSNLWFCSSFFYLISLYCKWWRCLKNCMYYGMQFTD